MLIVYFDGLCDTKTLDEVFLKPFMYEGIPNGFGEEHLFSDMLKQQLVAFAQVKTAVKMKDIINFILAANVIILVNGETKALIADLKGFSTRAIQESSTEVSIRGPKDSFTESFQTNTMLLRRRIKNSKLKIESLKIGELSNTDVAITYIEGIAQESILNEVRTRLKNIQIDGVLESGYIEEFIEDNPFSLFPQVQNTERPDIVIANLLEGKIGIIVDNTPFVLIVPMTFWAGMQAVEDYYERFIYTSFIRFIRYILFVTVIFLPALYVAFTTYHPKLIPTNLLISIAAAREGIPFPAFIEALLMEFMFEGLREAGIRLPKSIGSAVSIVGALVIGQAAVQAGIVSAPMVIVVAATGIASFAVPRYNLGTAVRLIRFLMLILAGFLGFFGIAVGFIALTIHLVNLRSFGVPYFAPVAPQIFSHLNDVFFRAPRWAFKYRPKLIASYNNDRAPKGNESSSKKGEKNK